MDTLTDEQFKELAQSVEYPNEGSNWLIRGATEYGFLESTKFLLNCPTVDPASEEDKPIRLAAKNGHTEIVKLLLDIPRVNPSVLNSWALCVAAENGHTGVVKLLLKDPRVDPCARFNYPIRKAAENGHTETVKILLEDPRIDPSDYDEEDLILRRSLENGNCLIDYTADLSVYPEEADYKENYAIRKAFENGHLDCVRALLADPRTNPDFPGKDQFPELLDRTEDSQQKEQRLEQRKQRHQRYIQLQKEYLSSLNY